MPSLTVERALQAHRTWQWTKYDGSVHPFDHDTEVLEFVKELQLNILNDPTLQERLPDDPYYIRRGEVWAIISNTSVYQTRFVWGGFEMEIPAFHALVTFWTHYHEIVLFLNRHRHDDFTAKLFGIFYLPRPFIDDIVAEWDFEPPHEGQMPPFVRRQLELVLHFFFQTYPTLRNNVYEETNRMQISENKFQYGDILIRFSAQGKLVEWTTGGKDWCFWWYVDGFDTDNPTQMENLLVYFQGRYFFLGTNFFYDIPFPVRDPFVIEPGFVREASVEF